MSKEFLIRASRITVIYLIVGIAWIAASDFFLLVLGLEEKDSSRYQTIKGIVFVALTALMLFFLLRRELTQQEQQQTESQKSKSFLEATLNSLLEAVFVIDPESRQITLCNRAAEMMFGYKQEEMIGQSTRMLHVDEDQFNQFGEISLRGLKEKGQYDGEFEMRRANGETFPTHHQIRTIFPESGWERGVVSVVRDLSEQKVTRRQLEHEEKVREAILENSADAIVVCDAEGRLAYFNKAARDWHGLDAMPVAADIWAPSYDLYHVDGKTPLAKEDIPLYRAFQGETVQGLEGVIAPPGKPARTFLSSAVPLYDEEGEKLGAVAIMHDVTDKIGREIALGQLEIAKKTLVKAEKMAEVGRLASGITHEILNPLNIISLHAQRILKDKNTPPDILKKIRSIKQEAHQINEICSQLLGFSRTAPVTDGMEPTQINSVLLHVMSLIERDSKYENIKFIQQFAPELPDALINRGEFRQVFFNLINNARHAMPGGGRVTVKTEPLVENGKTMIQVQVEDTGCGIHPDDIDKIFEPFFTTKPEGEGTGMGLAVAHGIIEKHQGRISVRSEVGKGTVFVVRFPAV